MLTAGVQSETMGLVVSFETALAFTAALLVWVLIPGPAILMVVGRSLSSGFRSTVGLILGILLGDVFYILLVFMGLAALGQILGDLSDLPWNLVVAESADGACGTVGAR